MIPPAPTGDFATADRKLVSITTSRANIVTRDGLSHMHLYRSCLTFGRSGGSGAFLTEVLVELRQIRHHDDLVGHATFRHLRSARHSDDPELLLGHVERLTQRNIVTDVNMFTTAERHSLMTLGVHVHNPKKPTKLFDDK